MRFNPLTLVESEISIVKVIIITLVFIIFIAYLSFYLSKRMKLSETEAKVITKKMENGIYLLEFSAEGRALFSLRTSKSVYDSVNINDSGVLKYSESRAVAFTKT